MSFDWTELIRFSEEIHNFSSSKYGKEAIYRSIINRCYYGAFVYARNKAKYHVDVSKDVHNRVREFYINRPDRTEKKIGRNLKSLYDYRIRADYRNTFNDKDCNLEEASQKALTMARKIEGILNELG